MSEQEMAQPTGSYQRQHSDVKMYTPLAAVVCTLRRLNALALPVSWAISVRKTSQAVLHSSQLSAR